MKLYNYKCTHCGIEYTAKQPSRAKNGNRFCSLKCVSQFSVKSRRVYPKVIGICVVCSKEIIAKSSGMVKPNRKCCSVSCKAVYDNKNRVWTDEMKQKITDSYKNRVPRKFTIEERLKQSERLKGKNSHFWQGGLTEANRLLRNGIKVKIWRKQIFERDNYTCTECGARSGKGVNVYLNADHIKPWSLHPELRYELSNGRTLCLDCHKKTDTFGARSNSLKYQSVRSKKVS